MIERKIQTEANKLGPEEGQEKTMGVSDMRKAGRRKREWKKL